MVVAWPVLAVMGIFFAAWMKPALPKAEWFQVHRAAMLVSLFLGGVAFLLIFVAKRGTRGLVSFIDHFVVLPPIQGVELLALVNVGIALFIIYTVIAITTNSPPLALSTEVVADKAKDPPTGGVDTPPKPPSKLTGHVNLTKFSAKLDAVAR
ncbi:hypothetical protein EMCRGX_G020226 [Ephydatia muelleri]